MKIAALLLLAAIPILAGMLRLIDLGGGGHPDPETSARFAADPVPVVTHIVGATVFCVAGAFQFSARLRRSPWHRRAGRAIAIAGMAAALSGVWMAFSSPPAADGGLLLVLRIVFGSAMAAALVLGVRAARRRDIRTHRAWMTRAYAIGIGAGTQAVLGIVATLAVGAPTGLGNSLLNGLAWLLDLAVAEVVIRRAVRRSRASAPSPRTGAPRPPVPASTSGR